MINYTTLAKNGARLAQTARLFEIPIIVTEHTKFGQTDPIISKEHGSMVKIFPEKKNFSMLDTRVENHLIDLNRRTVILYGSETHICVK